jgi:signal transduction histidine kinase/DNA-binding response OmpR family regulator
MMLDYHIRILLVEDNPGDARLIREMLTGPEAQGISIEWVPRLSQGLEQLGKGEIDLVLLDLGLPDSRGLDTFLKAYTHAPEIPFVLLTGLDDETLALTAVGKGAQDYLIKGETDANTLFRAIRYATERKKVEEALRRAHNELEIRIQERTAELVAANQQLQEEIAKRREMEEALRLAHDNLELKVALRTAELAKANRELEEEVEERKMAEETIKDREDQLTAIYENAPLIMMLVDQDLRVHKANKLAEEFAGSPASDLLGRHGGEALRCLHALDDPLGCGYGPHCQKCPVRLTVMTTFETGRSHHQVEVSRPFAIGGEVHDITFLLCTARLSVLGQPQVLVTIQDITKRKQAEEKLRISQNELRFLASKLLNAQERERERISRELHDELGQSLLVLKLQAGHIEKRLAQEQTNIKKACRDLMQQFDRLVADVRHLARDLSPSMVRDLGLSSALKRLTQDFSRHYGIQAEIDLLDGLDKLFIREAQINIYRIFQEALTNIGKYAQASQLRVTIGQKDGAIFCQIADNGKGFRVEEVWGRDPSHRGLGLMAMEERARMLGSTLEIKSAEGQGTQLALQILVPGSQAG